MKVNFLKKIIMLVLLCAGLIRCTEPYQLKTNTFEDALVIEATITNELKKQQIKISRTYRFEENGPIFESGATVYITDDVGNRFDFTEQDGVYESNQQFQAVATREYQLYVVTDDGKKYTSTRQQLTTVNEIQDISASVETINGERGVNIKVHSFDPSGASKYYRFEYEETYKVVAPKWAPVKMVLATPSSVDFVPRTTEARVCYSTKKSADIILSNTAEFSEDRIDFPIRFISNDDFIITHRYSILVKQFVQNLESYTYFKTLRELSGSGSILSPNQPGFLNGNIKSVSNSNEKVIGYFDVSSVSTKRIFFNYSDLFPGELKPNYFIDCEDRIFKYCFDYRNDPDCAGDMILTWASVGDPLFFSAEDSNFHLVPVPCGDCTTFSSNVIPSFWQ